MLLRRTFEISSILLVLLSCHSLNAQDSSDKDHAAFIRDAYKKIAGAEVVDVGEAMKLIASCRERLAIMVESDPAGLIDLAREIILDKPELLEDEKRRGITPPRLVLKGAIMGAVVLLGGEEAELLLEELAEKVRAGEAESAALGSNPDNLLNVPMKYDRAISEALEGTATDPEADLKGAVRFAQSHVVAEILLAENIPSISPEGLAKIKMKALSRLESSIARAKFTNPLMRLKYDKIMKIMREACNADTSLPMPPQWRKRLERNMDVMEKRLRESGAAEIKTGMKKLPDASNPRRKTRSADSGTENGAAARNARFSGGDDGVLPEAGSAIAGEGKIRKSPVTETDQARNGFFRTITVILLVLAAVICASAFFRHRTRK
ncbi:MAG: hypothetical protein E3J72_22365 [Planctomycetota bacterium]|nr:MAG: hypothetical protein E3J72_22365 [Planctomycetota bacterium]